MKSLMNLTSLFTKCLTMVVGTFLVISLLSSAANAQPIGAPNVAAKSYLLIDYDTGEVLLSKNAEEVLPPASLTKMMTSYIVADQLHRGIISGADKVLISENAWAQNPKLRGSSLMFVEANKYVSVADLHRGIVIQSGNDASIAMAEHIAGSEEAFAQLMNQHAKRLGMHSTNFVNSTGLPAANHVTTAKDLAILARALIRDFPSDYSVYSEQSFTFNKITQQNRNELLNDKNLGVDGIKTGHTDAAGYCLVASAQQGSMRLISVVMGTETKAARASESRKLLNHGFRFYTNVMPFKAGQALKQARVWKGELEHFAVGLARDAKMTVLKTDKAQLKANYKLHKEIMAPIKKGQVVGELTFKTDAKIIKQLPIVALQNVEEAGILGRMWDSMKLWFE